MPPYVHVASNEVAWPWEYQSVWSQLFWVVQQASPTGLRRGHVTAILGGGG